MTRKLADGALDAFAGPTGDSSTGGPAGDSEPKVPVQSAAIHRAPDGELDPMLTRAIIDDLADGVYFVDPGRRITYWNHGAEKISGYSSDYVVNHRCYENILNHVDANGTVLCHTACPLASTIKDGQPRDALVWLKHKDGHRKPVRLHTAQVRDAEGRVIGGVEIFKDESEITHLSEEAERARHEALTDPLTGLPNRRFFDTALATRLENRARYGWEFGLLIVDIDHFKKVNDQHGHAFGDEVLKVVARTLHGAVRAGDVIARWGGEEFTVLVEASDVARLEEAAERLRVLVARSEVRRDEATQTIHVSVGGTLANSLDSAESLFNRADEAMRQAKRAGRDRVSILLEP
jgi:diguanylate cyclase (GGDEF)-like protein/PAS domain S-box-containing protein